MVSMKDIAKECHVSVATVSKALNGYSDIGRDKREEIRAAAERMGYFPNSSARALKTKRTYNLGVLFADATRSGLTHSYFAAILDSFKVKAEECGYDITFVSMGPVGGRSMSYYEHCRYRGLDGAVIACIDFDSPDVQKLIYSDLPIVTIDFPFDGRMTVISDNRRGMRDLTEYVLSMGHRKVAYIHGDDNLVTGARLESFRQVLQEHGIAAREDWMQQGRFRDVDYTAKLTRRFLERCLQEKDLPTCVFFSDDYAAVGGMNAIRSLQLRIPEDISIAGYDGIMVAETVSPKLTTLHQDTKKIGRMAALKLISLIENPENCVPEKIMIEGTLVKGESVRRIAISEG